MTEIANYFLDITNEVCPLTFVRTKLQLERMEDGAILELRLKGLEPLKNVPISLREIGQQILSFEPEAGEDIHGIHRLRVRKTART